MPNSSYGFGNSKENDVFNVFLSFFFFRKLVSNFALSLLTEFADEAIIPIVKLTPFLPKKVNRLKEAIDLRDQSDKHCGHQTRFLLQKT